MTSSRSIALALTAVLALVGGGCDSTVTTLCSPSDFDAEGGRVGDFGSGEAAAKVEAFLHATSSLVIEVASTETRLRTACTNIATDLGVPASELAGADIAALCQRASAEIRATIEANVPSPLTLALVLTPPACGVSIDAYADCVAECDVNASGTVDVTCTGGDLYGSCSGACEGTCSGSCAAGCQGTCGATCTGTCTGTCIGTCSGSCDQTNAAGECIGSCTGTCTGTCSGQCTGSCSGTCNGACQGFCEGECHGSCDVAFTEPKCDGEVEAQASAECQSACDAQVAFDVECSRPAVSVALAADVSATQQAELDVLFATLEANLPDVFEIAVAGSSRLKSASEAFVVSLQGVGSVVDAGARAAACTASAVTAALDASARIDVSIMATIEVTGSVSAQGMAGAGP